jgi:hypothetical protein
MLVVAAGRRMESQPPSMLDGDSDLDLGLDLDGALRRQKLLSFLRFVDLMM